MSQMSPTEMLAKLVAFDTTSSRSNMPLIDFVRGYLDGYNIKSELVMNSESDKANLFATLGPADIPGIGLSGHTDTVPVKGQTWSSNPYELTEKDGRLYGRGTCDMKGFLACTLCLVPILAERQLKIPVHLIFSYDEEVGCAGVRPLVSELGSTLVKPRIVIVGEPTSMQVVDAHKSIDVYVTEITGEEAHSSAPQIGVNAILAAAEHICELNRIRKMMELHGGGDRFDPPYTSVHVGKIDGGTAVNIVPKYCKYVWEFRSLPGTDREEIPNRLAKFAEENLIPAMSAVSNNAKIETRHVREVPVFSTSSDSDAVILALKLAGQNETHAVSYGTEAGLFESSGCSTVVCGPGNIEQAHKPDEYIETNQLEKCMIFLTALANHVSN